MGLKGKLTAEKEIKCHGDVFHDLFGHKPHHIANVAPNNIHGCKVHEGQFGAAGSVLSWEFTHDGKKKTIKVEVAELDRERKLVKYKAVGGEILELYKVYNSYIHVDTSGDDHVVTVTIEYEKVSEDVEDPVSYLELGIKVIRDIEAHHAN